MEDEVNAEYALEEEEKAINHVSNRYVMRPIESLRIYSDVLEDHDYMSIGSLIIRCRSKKLHIIADGCSDSGDPHFGFYVRIAPHLTDLTHLVIHDFIPLRALRIHSNVAPEQMVQQIIEIFSNNRCLEVLNINGLLYEDEGVIENIKQSISMANPSLSFVSED
eukprot:gene12126-14187_t